MVAELLQVTGVGMALNYGVNKVTPTPVPVGSRSACTRRSPKYAR